MKKLLLIFTILFWINEIKAQKLPWYQSGNKSCWAASLGWVASRLGDTTEDQCFFIKLIDPASLCLVDTNNTTSISQVKLSGMAKTKLLYFGEKNNSVGLNYMKHLFLINKPLIYNYRYDGGDSHIVVMDNIENQVFNLSNHNISLIKISDPWPVNAGNEYYITYERYYSQFYNNVEPPDIATGKYTLFYDDKSESFLSGMTDPDKDYLSKVIFHNTSKGMVATFLGSLGSSITNRINTFSDNFFIITNLPRNDIGTLTTALQYGLLSVSDTTLIRNLIPTLLNMEFHEKLVSITKNDTIVSMATVSNKKVYGITTYSFYNNWILYHIEKGKVLQNLSVDAKLAEMNLQVSKDKDGIIIQCADTYFAITEKDGKYYVYDLYGDGFNKIQDFTSPFIDKNNKFLAFDIFQKLLTTNFYKKK